MHSSSAELKNQETEDLLGCIRDIKQKFRRNQYFKTVANRPALSLEDFQQKNRAMVVAFDAIASQNKQLSRVQNNYGQILKSKDALIQLKEIQIKKYRNQALQALSKNEELVNYSRQLALEYNNLLNSIKDCDETALTRQASTNSKLTSLENQVTFLRKKVLDKQNKQDLMKFRSDKIIQNRQQPRIKSHKSIQSSNSKKKIQQIKKSKDRKSLVSLLK